MMTIKIRPVFWWNSPGLGKCSRFLRSGHKRSTKKYFQLSLNFCPLTLCWDGLFWSLKALIRSSLIAFAMITRIGSLSSKLRHHFHCDSICLCTECIRLGAIVRIPKTPTIATALNSNFRIALFQLFALLVVLRVLRVVLARRTSPLDDEEDDDEEDDDGEENPDHNWHQKSIRILVRGVDGVLEQNRFLSRCIFPILCFPGSVLLNVLQLW